MENEHQSLVKAFREALGDGNPSNPLLVARIPIICNDIREIKINMRWMIGLGSTILIGIGMLALKSLGV